MKKILFCIFCMVGTIGIVSAQEILLKVDTVAPQQPTCAPLSVFHWSFGVKAGVSDYMLPPDFIKNSDRYNMSYGGFLEYTINPLIGLGFEYDYNDYSRPYSFGNVRGKLDGLTQDFILYGSVNISNALAPLRTGFWHGLNIYGDLGGGVAYYQYALNNARLTHKESMMAKLGLDAEISLSRWLGLILSGQFNQYDTRMLSGVQSNGSGDAWICSVGLRFKLGGISKNHVRNINLCEFSPQPEPIIVTKTYMKGDTDELLDRVKVAEKENAATKIEFQKMKDAVK